jgi:hypothetical protein
MPDPDFYGDGPYTVPVNQLKKVSSADAELTMYITKLLLHYYS